MVTGSMPFSGVEPWQPFPLTVRTSGSNDAMQQPGTTEMVPDGSDGPSIDPMWIPKTASTPSITPSFIAICGAFGDFLGGLEDELDVSAECLAVLVEDLHAPISIAACVSCPQACILPSCSEAKGSPVSSCIGSASMSARRSTVLPGFPPFISPIIPESPLFFA